MTTYQEAQAKAQAEADKWMQDNASKLEDCHQADYMPAGTKKFEGSHELYGDDLEQARHTEVAHNASIMALVTAIDVDRGYYEETDNESTAIEHAGIFNVKVLECWKGKLPQSIKYCEKQARSVWGYIGTDWNSGFRPEAYQRRQALVSKRTARFGIGFCYKNNGLVRSYLKSEDQTKAEMQQRVITLDNILDDLSL